MTNKDLEKKEERMEGKLRVLILCLILDIFSFLCVVFSFVTPYWIISWPRVFSPFRKMGLWEVCLNGFIKWNDPSLKAYHGCWWIYSPELYGIRSYLMTPWFIVVQILITLSMLLELLLVLMDIFLFFISFSKDYSGFGRRRAPYGLVQTVTILTIVACVMKTIAVIIFGLASRYDPFWLVLPEINYPHISYGLAILSGFASLFSSMSHRAHRTIVKIDDYENPVSGQGGYQAGSRRV